MPDLSVILAFCNEYPQLIFTVRSIVEELRDRVDVEVIAVDNYCPEVEKQGYKKDKGGGALKAAMEGNPWLTVLEYDTRLSHWQAKNLGVKHATAPFLWFPDAHVMPSRDSLVEMFLFYRANCERLNGTMHLPLTYQILEWRRLIYGLIAEPKHAKYFYEFAPMPSRDEVFEVPVMSTCGCLMTREIFDRLGGWPEEIGIYGGGEPFFNFCMAVMGLKKWIWPHGALFHHGDNRGYHWNHDGWCRDEVIATYMYGGQELAEKKLQFMEMGDGSRIQLWSSIRGKESILRHRELIAAQQQQTIEEWALQALAKGGAHG